MSMMADVVLIHGSEAMKSMGMGGAGGGMPGKSFPVPDQVISDMPKRHGLADEDDGRRIIGEDSAGLFDFGFIACILQIFTLTHSPRPRSVW